MRARPSAAILIAILIVASVAGEAAALQATAPPPPKIYTASDGVTSPQVIQDVKPRYTADAMRARIEGVAGVRCVVMPDGTVANVTITRSLDSRFGLDRQAIAAVSQWRFRPGTKDGVAVPVMIDVEVSFKIRDKAEPVPSLAWPDAFIANASEPSGGDWVEDRTDAGGLQIKVAYPRTWRLRKNELATRLLGIQSDGSGTWYFGIAPPRATTAAINGPMSPETLQRGAEVIKGMSNLRGLQIRHTGQVQTADHLWIWFETAVPTFNAADVPPALAGAGPFDGMTLWMFTTIVSGQILFVSCMVLNPTGASESERAEDTRRAGLQFAEMMKRISIRR